MQHSELPDRIVNAFGSESDLSLNLGYKLAAAVLQGLVESGAGAGGAGESVVEVDPVLGDTEFTQPLPLGGQVL